MYINAIELKNFRNYTLEKVAFNKGINIVCGNNGQGKTNLLEAIYILSMGKSFRTSKISEMVQFDKDYLAVKGYFIKNEEELEIDIQLSNDKKLFNIDGLDKKKHADLLENVYIIVFSPEDLRLVKDEPEKRRKFLDRELCLIRPLYYKTLSQYKKVLLQRNFMLKSEEIKKDLLDIWDENLAFYGSKIIKERYYFIEKLKKISGKIHGDITKNKEVLELSYEANISFNENEKIQKDIFLNKLIEKREIDLNRKTTSVGPHRDDLKINISNIDVRNFGSQGQQRTAALSLKLAEIKIIKEETNEEAIILLDDVLSELDKERQSYLINSFLNNQVFISSAELSKDLIEKFPNGSIYNINNGHVLKRE